jgi:hypothetical protein
MAGTTTMEINPKIAGCRTTPNMHQPAKGKKGAK